MKKIRQIAIYLFCWFVLLAACALAEPCSRQEYTKGWKFRTSDPPFSCPRNFQADDEYYADVVKICKAVNPQAKPRDYEWMVLCVSEDDIQCVIKEQRRKNPSKFNYCWDTEEE